MNSANGYRAWLMEYLGREASPQEKYGHQPRLYALTKLVGKGLEYDDDVVFAASWLHDLGVFVGHRPDDVESLSKWDHVAYALERTPAILEEAGFPTAKTMRVLEVIKTHQPQDDPKTVEGLIMRDADILEQLGAVGILRTVSKVGRDTRFQTFTEAVASLRRSCTELPGKLRTATARDLAEQKVRVLREFLGAVEAEAGQYLC
jgi:uncharacterized protein